MTDPAVQDIDGHIMWAGLSSVDMKGYERILCRQRGKSIDVIHI
jgi:hypothetical protein